MASTYSNILPKESSKSIPAPVIFCIVTIFLIISGIMSAGGLICIRNFNFSPSILRHCLQNKKKYLSQNMREKYKTNVFLLISLNQLSIFSKRMNICSNWRIFFNKNK